MEEAIVNRVAKSPLISFDLEEYYPKGERVLYDLKDNLFQGLILREKDFRDFVKTHDWSQYQDKFVAVTCTVDAIVPTWAYMLLTVKLTPFAKEIVFGNLEDLEKVIFQKVLDNINIDEFQDKKIVIKGCSNLPVPISAYVEITRKLQPIAQSLMYGEPCSTVPLYKKPKARK